MTQTLIPKRYQEVIYSTETFYVTDRAFFDDERKSVMTYVLVQDDEQGAKQKAEIVCEVFIDLKESKRPIAFILLPTKNGIKKEIVQNSLGATFYQSKKVKEELQ